MSYAFAFDNNVHVMSIDMVQASDMFRGEDGDAQIKEIRGWLNAHGVRDFEPVSLYCDQLKMVILDRTVFDSPFSFANIFRQR